MTTPTRGNATIAMVLVAVVAGMTGLAFASPPLYRLFCAVTGYGGTPDTSGAANTSAVTNQTIAVRFNADTNPNLPWHFQPDQPQVTLKLGEEQVAFYSARNEAGRPVTGVAVYNVTPEVAGKYFHKTACFCFNEQTLAPNQKMEFPVSFWVDPAIRSDANTSDIKTITLSYTFFRSLTDAEHAGALANAGPHVGPLVR